MYVWLVSFIEDSIDETHVFSTREKAWEYLQGYYERIGFDESDYYAFKADYVRCCEQDGDYFMNDFIIVCKKQIDEK